MERKHQDCKHLHAYQEAVDNKNGGIDIYIVYCGDCGYSNPKFTVDIEK